MRRCTVAVMATAVLLALVWHAKAAGHRELRVCADPNNLPFSNDRLEGFENRIADLLAAELDTTVRYTWWAQRHGFPRNTLKAGQCDLVPGVPAGMEALATTRPYYRSSYVFVTRQDRPLTFVSLDDPRLRVVRIGVPMIGDEAANAPPVHALSRRGVVDNDYREPNPPARLIEAVARGDIDVALAWGPVAGYFVLCQSVPLAIEPVFPLIDVPTLPMIFDISMGLRREEARLKVEVEAALERLRPAIDAVLAEYGVPRLDPPRSAAMSR